MLFLGGLTEVRAMQTALKIVRYVFTLGSWFLAVGLITMLFGLFPGLLASKRVCPKNALGCIAFKDAFICPQRGRCWEAGSQAHHIARRAP